MDTITLNFWENLARVLKGLSLKQGQVLSLLSAFKACSAEQMQDLINSGVLNDLAKVDPRQINRLALILDTKSKFLVKGVVRVGGHIHHDALFKDAINSGIRLDQETQDAFRKLPLPTCPTNIQLVEVSAEEVRGVDEWANSREEIFQSAFEHGLVLLDPIVALYASMQIEGIDAHLASDPIKSARRKHGFLRKKIFCFDAILRIRSLTHYRLVEAEEADRLGCKTWRSHSRWLFGLPHGK